MKKSHFLFKLTLALLVGLPGLVRAWEEPLTLSHNISEYSDCSASAVNLRWISNDDPPETKSGCNLQISCATFCGSKGGRCHGNYIVDSTATSGRRYVFTSFTGGGDWSGVSANISGNDVYTSHVEHDDPGTLAFNYKSQYRVRQQYQVPAGFTAPAASDNWYDSGTANIGVSAGPLTLNGTNLICVGWTSGSGGVTASGSQNSVNITSVTEPTSITWIYVVAFNITLLVNGATSTQAELQPHNGIALVRADQAFSTSVRESFPDGQNRYRSTGWTNGTGDFPLTGTGTLNNNGGNPRLELNYPVSGGLSIRAVSSLTWNYVPERRLEVHIDPTLPENIRALIAAAGPTPPAGTNWTTVGASVPASTPIRVVDGSLGAVYACQGYSATGSVNPSTGTANSVTFNNTNATALTWNYKRAYTLNVGFILDNGDAAPAFVVGNTNHTPPAGNNDVIVGATPTYRAAQIVDSPQDGVRYVCIGWQGSGDVPASGQTNNVTSASVSQNSALTWIYRRENRLRVIVNPASLESAASPTPPVTNNWYAHNAQVEVSALLTVSNSTTNVTCLGSFFSLGGLAAFNSVETVVGAVPNQRLQRTFTLDDPATITWPYVETEEWIVGQPITPPPGAATNVMPTPTLVSVLDSGDTAPAVFKWYGPSTNRALYAVKPVPSAQISWPNGNITGAAIVVAGRATLPEATTRQRHVANVPTPLQSLPSSHSFVNVAYTSGSGGATNGIFNAATPGTSVLLFTLGVTPDPLNNPVAFEIVETIDAANQANVTYVTWEIGKTLTNEFHRTRNKTSGYVFYSNALYDAAAYTRSTRQGPILPVNKDTPSSQDDMLVVWYEPGNVVTNLDWPVYPYHYTLDWPADGSVDKIYIASQQGSGPLADAVYPQPSIYFQNDPAKPGFNPNEEHAALFDLAGQPAAFALRNDLNAILGDSLPYVLLKFMDPFKSEWAMKVYKVEATGAGNDFRYPLTAGFPILPPYPLPNLLPLPTQSVMSAGIPWYHRDHKSGHWAKAAASGTNTAQISMRWFYPLQDGWVYPDFNNDNQPDAVTGQVIPLLNGGLNNTNPPVEVVYDVSWPTNSAILSPGETLTASKKGLPDVFAMASAEVIFDEGVRNGVGPLAKLLDPISERFVPLAQLPDGVLTEQDGARQLIKDLPAYLKRRLTYDPINKRLYFRGVLDTSGVGEPLLLLNVMSLGERNYLQTFNSGWASAIGQLYDKTRNPENVTYAPVVFNPFNTSQAFTSAAWNVFWGIPLGLKPTTNLQPKLARITGLPKALTAGAAKGTGFVTVVENDDPLLGAAPVALHVLRVGGPPYVGEIKVIKSDNLFDEKLTLRHSGDFGGEPERMLFTWYYQPDTTGFAPPLPSNAPPGTVFPGYLHFATAVGQQEITIEGASPLTLADNWFATRYGYTNAFPFVTNNFYYSLWAGQPGGQNAQLAEGWIKRVLAGLNPFDARVLNFHASPVNTIVSMLAQAGARYEGPIAFNGDPCNLNSIGLIEAYQSILSRGRLLSIDSGINFGPANVALLNASTRLADFYMLLGNEAFQDAQDPTIGFGTTSGEYGTLAPSIFTFMNQVATPLEEELVLLRGRDDSQGPTRAAPVYNRFFWNFTQGEGELAYQQTYNISDQLTVDTDSDGCFDETSGNIDENDAKILYPQGHGDAWGHYLTATKFYYELLAHPNYAWEPRVESVLVGGAPITIDYLDERKFCSAAAAKARTGVQIVNNTYRLFYVDDPAGQWQGYKDTDRDRAWGMDDWARRAGQAAYFDWAVANAILPSIDPNTNHTGIAKIDRTTVAELGEISTQFADIQSKMDQADKGLNPLGLAKGVVPFDIDPSFLEVGSGVQGKTHFEQVYLRALDAMKNAGTVFNYANQLTQMLRQNQDTLEDFSRETQEMERDYINRLIEIFGYPYPDDIGPGGVYPTGYEGPDWIHFMYVDPSELTGDIDIPSITNYTVSYNFTDTTTHTDQGLGLTAGVKQVSFSFTGDGRWMVKPSGWTGVRRAPGEIQNRISDLILAQANLEMGLEGYNQILNQVGRIRQLLEAQYNQNLQEIQILTANKTNLVALNDSIEYHNKNQLALRRTAETSDRIFEAIIESIPKVAGIAASDVAAPARGALFGVSAAISIAMNIAADAEESAQLQDELAKEEAEMDSDLRMATEVGNRVDLLETYQSLLDKLEEANIKRLEISTLKEQVEVAAGAYMAAVAAGERLLDERAAWRKSSAPQVQDLRYQDMSFRLFRNEALQKYRAQFDLAARYVYLAAAAYDYETCLLGSDTGSGREFMTDIVRQRGLGQMVDDLPVAGTPGLADPMARLNQNFAVYRTQMGFNNPIFEGARFSLRKELLRIKPWDAEADPETDPEAAESDRAWRNALAGFRVDDLRALPEFRRFCRPFAPDSAGPQPAIVIPFKSYIQYGRNYFGWPLAGGDSTYDPTRYATKIRSAGVWFSNYDSQGLSFTPRAYIVPVGTDIHRSPSGDTLSTREFKVVDQKIPVPFPMGQADLEDQNWIPINDSLSDTYGAIRRFSRVLAYHDSGDFDPAETATDTRLIGRSVWNTQWMLIIPGETLLNPPDEGLDTFIDGLPVPGGQGERDGNGVKDILIYFQTYSYSGN